MGHTLTEIAQQLKDSNKKVQLIYAFNGVGKTRLSGEFKNLISPKGDDYEDADHFTRFFYYNAFIEDLFYWDNDLDEDSERKLKIHPNAFTKWVLDDQGQDQNIISHFQRYTNDKLTPKFNEEYLKNITNPRTSEVEKIRIAKNSEVTFSLSRGNDEYLENIKISKGEESNFVWCVFYSLLNQVVDVLNVAEPSDRETDQFNNLEYVFIDDPVTSLDENHLILLAVDLAELIKSSKSNMKFIITTHNPLFYNVLYNELNNKDIRFNDYRPKHCKKYRFEKLGDGSYEIKEQFSDSPFSYHLYLLSVLEKAVETEEIYKYHFNLLRNILEKASTFLGYNRWEDLLPNNVSGERAGYVKRILNFSSHSKYAMEEVTPMKDEDKLVLKNLVKQVKEQYHFKPPVDVSEVGEEEATDVQR